ncbi:MAG: ParB/RepB/Spo0J family partition protein [Deltaproteobacteria bacterium]|nr:ParB/RepB/Spo0J family partition protein [Deltaproteobacteria bacterium]
MNAAAKSKRPALGMGLDALLPDRLEGEFFLCPVEEVHPSPSQPRQEFDPETLEELAQSIREKGLIQPVVLRKRDTEGYELIAGERRWRAAQRAGLREIPAIVREASEEEVLELALIENLQREDLNPADEARGYRLLLDRTDLSQEELAQRIGKSRAAVANALRLLTLPPAALDALRSGSLTAGHARAVLAVEGEKERLEVLDEVLRRGLSVRQAEALAKRRARGRDVPHRRRDPDLKALEDRLSKDLGTKVVLKPAKRKGAGHIAIPYRSLDDLDRLLALLGTAR